MRLWTTLAILTISSLTVGCATVEVQIPICPDREFLLEPLVPISIESQARLLAADADALTTIAQNDLRLKAYIRSLEALIEEHDELAGGCE